MINQTDNLKTILQKKKEPKLSEGFDVKMMSLIHKHSKEKNSSKKSIRLIYIFFALGLALGLNVSFSFENIEIPYFEFSINRQFLGIPLIFGLIFIFDKVYKTIQFQKGDIEIL